MIDSRYIALILYACPLLAAPIVYYSWRLCLHLFYKYPNPPIQTVTVPSEPLVPYQCHQVSIEHFKIQMSDEPPDYSNFSPPTYEEVMLLNHCTIK